MDKKYLVKMMSFLCMGDGALFMHKGCVNASFHLSQTKGVDDLVCMAALLLDELKIGYKITEYTIQGKPTVYTRLASKVHPFLTKLYYRIYQDGRRVLDPHAFKQLDWESFAILYMSDGNLQKNAAMLNLCRLSYAEFMWLRSQIKEKLGVNSKVYRCGKYWRLGFRVDEAKILFEKVRPYVLEGYRYKLPNEEPRKGDDIV